MTHRPYTTGSECEASVPSDMKPPPQPWGPNRLRVLNQEGACMFAPDLVGAWGGLGLSGSLWAFEGFLAGGLESPGTFGRVIRTLKQVVTVAITICNPT